MEKDYIFVTKKDGSLEKMEVVSTFTIENYNKDYIIYKDENNRYYAASYDEEDNLDVNLSDEEKRKINEIFNLVK